MRDVLERYKAEHGTWYLAAVYLLIDVRKVCKDLKVSFTDAWHASGSIYRQHLADEKRKAASSKQQQKQERKVKSCKQQGMNKEDNGK